MKKSENKESDIRIRKDGRYTGTYANNNLYTTTYPIHSHSQFIYPCGYIRSGYIGLGILDFST